MAGNVTSFSKVTVDNATRQRSKFNLNHSYSGSFGFGEVLPVHCQKMVPDSNHVCGTRALVRLDPMVAPTSQGRITCKQWHSFVGLSDLFRDHAAFLTAQPISVGAGVKAIVNLPRMSLAHLSAFCLVGCKFTPYRYNPNTKKYLLLSDSSEISSDISVLDSAVPDWVTSTPSTDFQARWPNYALSGVNWAVDLSLFGSPYAAHVPCGNVATVKGHFWHYDNVSIDKCDYVFERKLTVNGSDHYFAFAVNFSTFGKRIYNILQALGYGVDFHCLRYVDLTRLFAFYIAYYGSFGLSLYTNYETTYCSQFLRGYENGRNLYSYISQFYPTGTFGSINELNDIFALFMQELADAYVTEPVDYISAHRKKDVSGTNDLGFVNNIVRIQGVPGSAMNSFGGSPDQNEPASIPPYTGAVYINNVSHTQVDADLLKLLYKSINKQTVAGRRIGELLRAGGYGSYVDEMKSHFIGYTEFDIDVSDINATSDGVNTITGKSSNLGEYVGKGIGSSVQPNKPDKKFSYETDEFGYWITLCAIVPDSSYCQGADQTVFDVNRFDQYSREYDGIGYEVQDRSVVKMGQNYIPYDHGNVGNPSQSQDSFGFVPRMTRYKVARSVLAGNFSLRSRRDAYLPFVLSRWIDADDIHLEQIDTVSDGVEYTMNFSVKSDDLPIAGNAWRYINMYPWLANFDRIFAFSEPKPVDYTMSQMLARWKYCTLREDYFMVFMKVQHTAYAPMLPIEDSWSTTDDNDGKGSAMTQA